MAEQYEDLIANGKVIGRILVSDGSGLPPVSTHRTEFYADDLLSEFTPPEIEAIDASPNANVQKFVRRLTLQKKVLIDSNSAIYSTAMGLLLSQSLITQARHDELIQGLPI